MTDQVRHLDELIQAYSAVLRRYRESAVDPTRRADDPENRVDDEWHDQHYISVGRRPCS